MASTNREVCRDKLVALLTANMIGANQAQTVTGHKLDIEGLAPVVYVRSAGTMRTRESFTYDFPTFLFDVVIYTQQATTGWADAQACDMVDKLEQLLAQVVETHRGVAEWELIGYTGPSTIEEISLGTGGNRYYKETIPLLVKLAKS